MSDHPREALSALLDGELRDAERRAVEAHLASCASCARHLRELTALDAMARGLPPVAAPEDYYEALPGRVRRRLGARRPALLRAPWLWPLAAGLALAVLAPLVLRETRTPQAPEAQRTAGSDRAPEVTASGPAAAAPEGAVPAPQSAVLAPQPADREQPAPPTISAATEADARRAARNRQEGRRDAPAPDAGAAKVAQAPALEAAPPPPAIAPAAPAPARESAAADAVAGLAEEVKAAPDEVAMAGRTMERPNAAAGAPSAALRKREGFAAAPGEEEAFRAATARPLVTAPEARRARQAWERFLAGHPRGSRADEARVRIIEASVAAYRAGNDPADRAAAERDAGAYLSSLDAPQAARVRAALARLDAPR